MVGHVHIIQFFEQAIERGSLSHAYLLVGPKHVGKSTIARTIAAKLVDTELSRLEVHPDVRIVGQELNEKTGKLKKDIGISQVRDVRMFAASGPVQAAHSVIIIEAAELLSKAAANGLLKTLEEPHPQTVLFLTVTDIDRVPETIASRAQCIAVPPVDDTVIRDMCADVDASTRDMIVPLAGGLPGIAYTMLTDETVLQLYRDAVAELTQCFGAPLYEKRNIISHLFDSKEDHIRGREAITNRLSIWGLHIRHLLATGTFPGTAVQAVAIYDTIESTTILLRQNVHPRAAMDALLLTIP